MDTPLIVRLIALTIMFFISLKFWQFGILNYMTLSQLDNRFLSIVSLLYSLSIMTLGTALGIVARAVILYVYPFASAAIQVTLS